MSSLAEYVRTLIGELAVGKAAKAAGIAAGTLQYILTGETEEPKPDTLAALALRFGEGKEGQRRAYADMMNLAGYLDMMPDDVDGYLLQLVKDRYPSVWETILKEGRRASEEGESNLEDRDQV